MWSSSFWTFGPMAFYSNKPYEFYTTTASGKWTSTFNSGNTYKSAWSTGCQFEDFSNATRSLGEVSCDSRCKQWHWNRSRLSSQLG